LPRDPLVSTGYQMFAGGVLLLGAGLLTGELNGLEPRTFSTASLLAMAYLLVFGSLGAFTSYTWLLQHAPVSRVSTYAYVNPVVAVLLGALVLNEELTPTLIVGALIVITAVAFIVRTDTASEPAVEAPGPTTPAPEPEAARPPGQPGAAGAPGQPAP
jgi:drug/metabolite transporter (DMT)-like permease